MRGGRGVDLPRKWVLSDPQPIVSGRKKKRRRRREGEYTEKKTRNGSTGGT